MKNIIELLRLKIGLWLIQTKSLTATEIMLRDRVNNLRCIHCGKNPYYKEDK